MIKSGILNPHLLHLLARVRHTNSVVIVDRGFPSWPELETVDLSLTDNIPTVLEVLRVILPNFQAGVSCLAQEFFRENNTEVQDDFRQALASTELQILPHVDLKKRVPGAVGIIRTGDTTQYANVILVSA